MQPDRKPTKKYFFEISKIFGVAFEMGFIIAIPIVIFAFLGKWLDQKYHKSFFVFLGIALALISSGVWLTIRLKSIADDLKQAVKDRAKANTESAQGKDEHGGDE